MGSCWFEECHSRGQRTTFKNQSFPSPFGPKDQTHSFRLRDECLYPPRYLTDPRMVRFMSAVNVTKSCVVLKSVETTQASADSFPNEV